MVKVAAVFLTAGVIWRGPSPRPFLPVELSLERTWEVWSACFNKEGLGLPLVIQWLRLYASNAEGIGSIPGWGIKIPHALWPKNEKHK